MAISERHRQYLRLMGIQPWEVRTAPSAVAPAPVVADLSAVDDTAELSYKTSHKPSLNSNLESHPSQSLLADGAIANMDWETLRRTALQCERCELHRTRTQVVFGVGDQQAQWLVVGEAPGAEEDRQGEPFVGRAGQLLNNMLLAIGLRREQTYIANVLKCRPPNNRDPKPEEAACCEPYLKRQVALLQPKIILAVGRIAAQNLLKTDASLSQLRGRTFSYEQGTPLVVTYHPAYLLRSPREKRKAWQDLQNAVKVFKQQT